MRWTRDSNAGFESGARLGKMLGDAYAQRQAGDAYKAATRQQETVSGEDAVQHFRDNYQAPQQNDVYNAPTDGPKYATADEYMAANPEYFRGLTAPGSAAGTYDRARSYTMGGQEQADKFSPLQVRNAGNQALGDYWSSRGDVERGLKYQEASDTGQAAQDAHATVGMRMKTGQQALDVGALDLKQKQDNQQALADYQKNSKDPLPFLTKQYNNNQGAWGEGDHANQKINVVKDANGGGLFWMTDADGTMVDKSATHFTYEQAQDMARHEYLNLTNPGKQAEIDQTDKHNSMLMDRSKDSDATTRRGQDLTHSSRMAALEARAAAAPYMHQQNFMPYGESDKGEAVLLGSHGGLTWADGTKLTREETKTVKQHQKVSGEKPAMHPEMQKEYMNKRYELLSTPAKTDVQKAEQENSLRALDTAFGVTPKGATPGGWAAAVAAENEKAKTRDTTMPAGSRMRSGLGSNVPEPIVFPPGFKYDPKEPQIPFKPGDAAVDDMIYGNHRR